MNAAQWVVVLLHVLNFFAVLHQDFHGRKARTPSGYPGAVVTVILTALQFWLLYAAGLFSTIVSPP